MVAGWVSLRFLAGAFRCVCVLWRCPARFVGVSARCVGVALALRGVACRFCVALLRCARWRFVEPVYEQDGSVDVAGPLAASLSEGAFKHFMFECFRIFLRDHPHLPGSNVRRIGVL